MRTKLWIGILFLFLCGFLLGVGSTIVVFKSQFRSTINGERTLLRSILQMRVASALDLNAEQEREVDAFLTDTIARLRIRHLEFEATVGNIVLSGLDKFIESKPENERAALRKELLSHYYRVRVPLKHSLFEALQPSITQTQAIESFMANSSGQIEDHRGGVKQSMYRLIVMNEERILAILDGPQQERFKSWLTEHAT